VQNKKKTHMNAEILYIHALSKTEPYNSNVQQLSTVCSLHCTATVHGICLLYIFNTELFNLF
jgi:hypothetical protein